MLLVLVQYTFSVSLIDIPIMKNVTAILVVNDRDTSSSRSWNLRLNTFANISEITLATIPSPHQMTH